MKKEKIHITLSKEHQKYQSEVTEIFQDFDVSSNSNLMRFSDADLPLRVIIEVVNWVGQSAAWDLLKSGIKSTLQKFPDSQISIRDDGVEYSIRPDLSAMAVVIPDRVKDFQHIKNLDDLVLDLKSKRVKIEENSNKDFKLSYAGLFVFILVSLVAGYLLQRFVISNVMSQFWVYSSIFACSLGILAAYFTSKNLRKYVETHTKFLTLASVILALSIFSFQASIDAFQDAYSAEDALIQSNNLNIQILTKHNPADLIPLDLKVSAYEQYYGYITKNYSLECSTTYLNLILQGNQFNSFNKQRSELQLALAEHPTTTVEYRLLAEQVVKYTISQIDIMPMYEPMLKKAIDKCQKRQLSTSTDEQK